MVSTNDADFWNSVQYAASQEVSHQGTQLVRVKVIEYVGLKVNIQREHATVPDDIPYPILDGVTTPAVGDWVWALQRFGGMVILGRNLLAGSELSKYALKTQLESYALKTQLESYLPKAGGVLTGSIFLSNGVLGVRGPTGTLEIRTAGSQHIRMYDESAGQSAADYILVDNTAGHFRVYSFDASASTYKMLMLIDKKTGVATFGPNLFVNGKSLVDVSTVNVSPVAGWAVINPIVMSKSASGLVTVSGRLQATTSKVADDIICGVSTDFTPANKGMFPCTVRDASGVWTLTVVPVYLDAAISRVRMARGLATGAQVDLAAITYAV